MFYGSTAFLMDPKNPKRPYTFFVFDDRLLIMEPPLNTITFSGNEQLHDAMMAKGYTQILGFISELKKKGDIISKNFLETVEKIYEGSLYIDSIAMADITSATVSKKLIMWYLTIEVKGGKKLEFRQTKKEIHTFSKVLEKALGSRLIWLKR